MVIALLHQKGGVGKTTMSINIASTLALRDYKVLLIDADPQGSAMDWHNAREKKSLFSVVNIPKPSIHKDIHDFIEHYDHIIIDGPPRVSALTRSIIMSADMILIPVVPGPFDMWAINDIVEVIEEVMISRENIKVHFLINQKMNNTLIGKGISESLSSYQFPVIKTSITHRTSFALASANGQSVCEMYPKSAASYEMNALVDYLIALNALAEQAP